MTRTKFIKIITKVMIMLETEAVYTCNELGLLSSSKRYYKYSDLRIDYENVMGESIGHIPVGFVSDKYAVEYGGYFQYNEDEIKTRRLNALAIYMAQGLAFKTYKDL